MHPDYEEPNDDVLEPLPQPEDHELEVDEFEEYSEEIEEAR